MKTSLIGSVTTGSIVVVGNWDPLGPAQRQLLRALVQEAQARSLHSAAVIFDPAPAFYLNVPGGWIEYESVETRVARLRDAGIDYVLRVGFSRSDLRRGVRELLDAVERRLCIRELWIGAQQSLGSGHVGNQSTIEAETAARGFGFRILGRPTEGMTGNPRRALSEGQVIEASKLVGFRPVWSRPKGKHNVVTLAWPAGRYVVAPVRSPSDPPCDAPRIELTLVECPAGGRQFSWPDSSCSWLSFVSGPSDTESTVVPVQPVEAWYASAD
jgi:FAD synthetase